MPTQLEIYPRRRIQRHNSFEGRNRHEVVRIQNALSDANMTGIVRTPDGAMIITKQLSDPKANQLSIHLHAPGNEENSPDVRIYANTVDTVDAPAVLRMDINITGDQSAEGTQEESITSLTPLISREDVLSTIQRGVRLMERYSGLPLRKQQAIPQIHDRLDKTDDARSNYAQLKSTIYKNIQFIQGA